MTQTTLESAIDPYRDFGAALRAPGEPEPVIRVGDGYDKIVKEYRLHAALDIFALNEGKEDVYRLAVDILTAAASSKYTSVKWVFGQDFDSVIAKLKASKNYDADPLRLLKDCFMGPFAEAMKSGSDDYGDDYIKFNMKVKKILEGRTIQ